MYENTDAADPSCSYEPSTSDSSKEPPRKKTKVWYAQGFSEVWLQDPELKDWIKQNPKNRYEVVCTVCSVTLTNANKAGLLAHKATNKHVNNSLAAKNSLQISTYFNKPKDVSLEDKVAKAEICLTAFMAEHSTPFLQADHLVECCKRMFPDSIIAQKMTLKLKRSKASYVMQHGIAHHERQRLISKCQRQKFSVIIDESTDVSVSQILAVVVRYFDEEKCEVVDSLLDLVEVADGTAEGLIRVFQTAS